MGARFQHKRDPFRQFLQWYRDAEKAGEKFPDAFALATVGSRGRPAVRMLLYKGLEAGEFQFFTNYRSRKARELAKNPRAAMVFFWPKLHRQLRIEGTVEKLSTARSQAYFATRERGSQLSAWASPQSDSVGSAKELQRRVSLLRKRFAHKTIPCPPFWGGFRLKPERFEFWLGRPHRLHERTCYGRSPRGWRRSLLAP